MPNIAQQDYIIIDWEGNDSTDAAKKAEVDAILKNTYLSNPLAMFSLVFKDFGQSTPNDHYFEIVASVWEASSTHSVKIYLTGAEDASPYPYTFSIA